MMQKIAAPRKGILLGIVAAAAVLAAGLWALFAFAGRGEEWSCEPEAARQEIEAGLAANRKYYGNDALEHFERALELSPDCAIAQLAVVRRLPWTSEKRKDLLVKLEQVDLGTLNDREAFLVRYHLAGIDKEPADQGAILDAYLARHPKDPYALEYRCENLWAAERFDEGEACYERLLYLNPNWVVAQNRLGYLAMARGEFAKAEDRFRTYRYVAPDQANPHDSLGELLVLRGRYQEAQDELDRALAIRSDFCASYEHLIFLHLDQGDLAGAHAALERGQQQGACGELRALACELDSFALYREQDWPALAARWRTPCHSEKLVSPWLPHLGALMEGDLDLARTIEAQVAAAHAEHAGKEKENAPLDLDLLQGLRHLAEGDPAAAEASLRRVDAGLQYKNLSAGRFKLYTRVALAEALRRQGKAADAGRLLDEVASVNPHYVALYRDGDLPFPGA